MTCAEADRFLPLVGDGELTADENRALQSHLQDCVGCRDAARTFESDRDMLASAFGANEPLPFEGGLAASVMSKLQQLAADDDRFGTHDPIAGDDLLAPDPGESGTVRPAASSPLVPVARPAAPRRTGGLSVMIVAAAAAAVVMILWITDRQNGPAPDLANEVERQPVVEGATTASERVVTGPNGRRLRVLKFEQAPQRQFVGGTAGRAPGTGNGSDPVLENADVPTMRDLDELENPGAGPTPTYMEGL